VRRLLASAGAEASGVVLRTTGAGYVLEVDGPRVDVGRFLELSAAGRDALARDDAGRAGELLRQALSLWRGPALGELADREFARVEAARLEEARLETLEELADAELAAGRPAETLALVDAHLAAHPLRERAWGQRMVALYRLGRQAEALRAYQEVRRLLGDELGIEPTPALRRLEQRILLHDPDLEAPEPGQQPAAAGEGAGASSFPSGGTLAFLFADIEASTPRWEADREAMVWDLARHDEILVATTEVHHGRRFTHTGDGAGMAFATASAALAAAVTAQRALWAQEWKSPAPLTVRMAVHAGVAECREGSYSGPTLTRVARLLGLAAGGQILCSRAAADLTQDDLPPSVTLVELGEHHLEGLARPEPVYQVSHPELPGGFPALRAAGSGLHNLPGSLTSFVGRQAELDELVGLLPSTRLLTLTGLGGTGKTRLALELAGRVPDRFPDGVWWVELSPVQDPALVAPEVVAALGIQAAGLGVGATSAEDRLAQYLASRELLLVLDNCEHLVDAVARLVPGLLARCPRTTVLTTSREVLGLPGELAWSVPGLATPAAESLTAEGIAGSDAVVLFCARARTAQPGFGLGDANAAHVARVCRRLDGIPLAIELAAARMRVLSAHQVAEGLDDRFRLLTGGARTVVARHQTLRAAMDWSFDLLPATEQELLARLCVFPQSFDLEAAQAVAAPGDERPGFEVLDLLGRLVDKSLVGVGEEEGTARYRLLETVRQYGAEKLAGAGEMEAVHRRHRDHYVAVARRRPRFSIRWLSTDIPSVHTDQGNFRAALDWALEEGDAQGAWTVAGAVAPYWFWSGRMADELERFERAFSIPGTPPIAELQGAFPVAVGRMEVGRAGTRELEETSRRTLELAHGLGDPEGIAFASYIAGCVANMGGEGLEEGRAFLERALAMYVAMGSWLGQAWCHYELAALQAEDVAGARAHLEQALELERQAGVDVLLHPHLMASLALFTALSGESDRSRILADEALASARSFPLLPNLVVALVRAAQAAAFSGRDDDARAVLVELLGRLRDLGAKRWVAETLEATAIVLERQGRDRDALRLIGVAGGLRGDLGELLSARTALSERVGECRRRLAARLGTAACELEEAAGRDLPLAVALAQAVALVEAPGHRG
jgi:predicted ATPase/class 3 adenylate cyclase